ncbi:rho/rac/cdc gtpase-activating protein [Anaeramoeba flamelloides]|uniref:Rho/rac/cdc gtpase-activating protein n=1 Tax=Anaeramoeba flamelloides TaxID=1746091 RepID=A0ABQ8YB87_9EUKA|nr:rho/rac/cdc gtpase-activating protein [Anaeramoeba flamelloides]
MTQYYCSHHNFKTKKKGHLKLKIGDTLTIVEDNGNLGYCLGKIVQSQETGLFPRSYVHKIESLEQVSVYKALKQGVMSKRRTKYKPWKKRIVKLYNSSLSWFKNENSNEPLGAVLLQKCFPIIAISKQKSPKRFILKSNKKEWEFRCKSTSEREVWIETINKQIKSCNEGTQVKKTKIVPLKRRRSLFRKKTQILPKINRVQSSVSVIDGSMPKRSLKRHMTFRFQKKKIDPFETTRRFATPVELVAQRDKAEVPKILTNSVIYIKKNGLQETGIFRLSGNKNTIDQYKKEFDSGIEINFENEKNVHNVSGLLKQWFRELPESLLTKKLYLEFINASENLQGNKLLDKIKDLITQLPKINIRIFEIISELIFEVGQYEEENKMSLNNLNLLFGPTLCSRRGVYSEDVTNMVKECAIMKILVENFQYIFEKPLSVTIREKIEIEDEKYKVIATQIYSNQGEEKKDNHLHFSDGYIISVINDNDPDLFYGRILFDEKGAINELSPLGYFPKNLVEKISDDELELLLNEEF